MPKIDTRSRAHLPKNDEIIIPALMILEEDGYIKRLNEGTLIQITQPGIIFVMKGGYKSRFEKEKNEEEEKQLNLLKLKVDYKIAKRVYKTYHRTQFVAWASFFLALFLGYLQLAKILKLWPYPHG